MDRRLIRMLHTLRSGRDALRSEMELWALEGADLDDVRLGRLRDAARSFREQAHSLLVMMAYESPPERLQEELDALIWVFGEVAARIEARLAMERPAGDASDLQQPNETEEGRTNGK
jgi:hypothetical protein